MVFLSGYLHPTAIFDHSFSFQPKDLWASSSVTSPKLLLVLCRWNAFAKFSHNNNNHNHNYVAPVTFAGGVVPLSPKGIGSHLLFVVSREFYQCAPQLRGLHSPEAYSQDRPPRCCCRWKTLLKSQRGRFSTSKNNISTAFKCVL